MNPTSIFAGILSCLLLMFTITHAYTLSGQAVDGEHHLLVDQPSVFSPAKLLSIYQNDGSIIDSEEHEFEKRRFNAWAGKRALMAKRRFNAWAGRR